MDVRSTMTSTLVNERYDDNSLSRNTSRTSRSTSAEPIVREVKDPWKTVTTATVLNKNARAETKSKASQPNALYQLSYTLPNAGNGMTRLTFPMRINEAQQRKGPNDAGNYYAVQFDVNDLKGKRIGTGYIGLQPRQDGKALVTFSGFNKHFSSPSGLEGADHGPGATNSSMIDFQFGHKYELTIERDEGNHKLLRAYVRDITDRSNPASRQHVKDLLMDQDALLANQQIGFIEHYARSIASSSDIAYTEGSFYAPSGVTEQGRTIEGSLTQGGLHGRFEHSTTGHRNTTTIGRRVVEVNVGIQGAK